MKDSDNVNMLCSPEQVRTHNGARFAPDDRPAKRLQGEMKQNKMKHSRASFRHFVHCCGLRGRVRASSQISRSIIEKRKEKKKQMDGGR